MTGLIFIIIFWIVSTFLGINLGAEMVAKDLANCSRINESELSEFSSFRYIIKKLKEIFSN